MALNQTLKGIEPGTGLNGTEYDPQLHWIWMYMCRQ